MNSSNNKIVDEVNAIIDEFGFLMTGKISMHI